MKKPATIVAALGLALLSSGCVSTKTYEDLIVRHQTEQQATTSLRDTLTRREQQVKDLERANARFAEELKKALEAQAAAPVAVNVDDELKRLRDELAGALTGDDWNILRADHAIGVRLDDGKDVLFMPGSWKLTDSAKKSLQALAGIVKDVLAKHSDYLVRVDGHTDDDPIRAASKQGVKSNLHLSYLRAEAVREYLIEKGIGKNSVYTLACGEYRPVSDQKKLNRRVEIWVSDAAGFSLNPNVTSSKGPSVANK